MQSRNLTLLLAVGVAIGVATHHLMLGLIIGLMIGVALDANAVKQERNQNNGKGSQ
jgi:uncharacterized membrane protein (UPF0136 family)